MFRVIRPLARRAAAQQLLIKAPQPSRRTFAGGPSPDLYSAIVLASGALGALSLAYAGYGGAKDSASSSKNGLEVAYSPTLKRPPALIPLLPYQQYVHPTCNTTRHYDRDTLTLLYFTASWCPPCKRFTPMLQDFYARANSKSTRVEILFVPCEASTDPAENAAQAKEYYDSKGMQFLTMPFDQPHVSDSWDELKRAVGCFAGPRDGGVHKGVGRGRRGIPTLALLNVRGEVVELEGRGQVERALLGGKVEDLLKEWKEKAEGSL